MRYISFRLVVYIYLHQHQINDADQALQIIQGIF